MIKLIFILIFAQSANAVTVFPPPENPYDLVPDMELLWEGKHKDSRVWTWHLIAEMLDSDLQNQNPKDIKEFCPKYHSLSMLDRQEFWAQLLSAMAKRESNFKPQTYLVECSKDPKKYGSSGKWFESRKEYCIPGHKLDGGVAISRGLFQISMQSANSYGCNIKEPKELHDAKKNISCAVKILSNWVRKDQRVAGKHDGKWRGGARYWSVMRGSGDSPTFIRGHVSKLKICQ